MEESSKQLRGLWSKTKQFFGVLGRESYKFILRGGDLVFLLMGYTATARQKEQQVLLAYPPASQIYPPPLWQAMTPEERASRQGLVDQVSWSCGWTLGATEAAMVFACLAFSVEFLKSAATVYLYRRRPHDETACGGPADSLKPAEKKHDLSRRALLRWIVCRFGMTALFAVPLLLKSQELSSLPLVQGHRACDIPNAGWWGNGTVGAEPHAVFSTDSGADPASAFLHGVIEALSIHGLELAQLSDQNPLYWAGLAAAVACVNAAWKAGTAVSDWWREEVTGQELRAPLLGHGDRGAGGDGGAGVPDCTLTLTFDDKSGPRSGGIETVVIDIPQGVTFFDGRGQELNEAARHALYGKNGTAIIVRPRTSGGRAVSRRLLPESDGHTQRRGHASASSSYASFPLPPLDRKEDDSFSRRPSV